jgi:hypothetical protein
MLIHARRDEEAMLMLPSEGELPASWGYSEGGWKWASMAYLPRNRADGDPVVICAGRTCWKWPPALPGALPWLQAGAWSFGCGLVESPLTLHFLTGCNARGQEPMNEAWPASRLIGRQRRTCSSCLSSCPCGANARNNSWSRSCFLVFCHAVSLPTAHQSHSC